MRQPHPSSRPRPFALIGCGIAAVCLLSCCGVGMLISQRVREDARRDLTQANAAWDAGRKDEAVVGYERILSRAGLGVPDERERPLVYARVIEYRVDRGETDAAKAHVEKALDLKVELPAIGPTTTELLRVVREDRARREAEEKAKREAEAKRVADEREARRKKAEASGVPRKGEIGVLEVESNDSVWVAADEKAQGELSAFSRVRNREAIEQLIRQGRVLVCEKGTRVTVVDPGFASTTVRVMDGRHAGKTGVVVNEFLHKPQ